jgi:hypothetical protein
VDAYGRDGGVARKCEEKARKRGKRECGAEGKKTGKFVQITHDHLMNIPPLILSCNVSPRPPFRGNILGKKRTEWIGLPTQKADQHLA